MKLSPDLSKAFNSVASKNDTSSLSFRRTQSCPALVLTEVYCPIHMGNIDVKDIAKNPCPNAMRHPICQSCFEDWVGKNRTNCPMCRTDLKALGVVVPEAAQAQVPVVSEGVYDSDTEIPELARGRPYEESLFMRSMFYGATIEDLRAQDAMAYNTAPEIVVGG